MSLARHQFEVELAHWRALGARPSIWWRDDDARAWTPALDRLIRVADGRPLAIAIIPDGDLGGLQRGLGPLRNILVSQHGSDHVNRRRPEEPVGEHAADASAASIAARVVSARRAMEAHGLAPAFYTPPWNRIDGALPPALAASGFDQLSGWGDFATIEGGRLRLDAHIDLLRWRPRARFRGAGPLFGALRRELKDRRAAGRLDEPIGLLTHHLDHDEPAWRFLGEFVDFARTRFDWISFDQAAAGLMA